MIIINWLYFIEKLANREVGNISRKGDYFKIGPILGWPHKIALNVSIQIFLWVVVFGPFS